MTIDQKYLGDRGIKKGDPIEIIYQFGFGFPELGYFESISPSALQFNNSRIPSEKPLAEIFKIEKLYRPVEAINYAAEE